MIEWLTQPASVLMPVRNELEVIEDVVRPSDAAFFQHLPEGSERTFDDGPSRDGAIKGLEVLERAFPHRSHLDSERDGFAASARRLDTEARCSLDVFTGPEGQYVARECGNVAEAFGPCDVAHGAKVRRQDPTFRKVASACFRAIACHLEILEEWMRLLPDPRFTNRKVGGWGRIARREGEPDLIAPAASSSVEGVAGHA